MCKLSLKHPNPIHMFFVRRASLTATVSRAASSASTGRSAMPCRLRLPTRSGGSSRKPSTASADCLACRARHFWVGPGACDQAISTGLPAFCEQKRLFKTLTPFRDGYTEGLLTSTIVTGPTGFWGIQA
jgi:hypothetical protein